MNHSDWLELAIVAFIVIGLGIAIWRGGAANPISTGRLQRDVAAIKGDIAKLKEATKGTAKASDVAHLKQDMDRTTAARNEAMTELRSQVGKIGDEVDALTRGFGDRLARVEAYTEGTAHQVDMLYQHIVAKGMG